MIPWSHPTAGIIGQQKFALYQEGDKVILDMQGRRRDLLVSCGQAEVLENQLRRLADICALEPPSLVRGEIWNVRVRSYDGLVCLRFILPFAVHTTRIPFPYKTAHELADLVQFKRQQAAYRMQFLLRNGG